MLVQISIFLLQCSISFLVKHFALKMVSTSI